MGEDILGQLAIRPSICPKSPRSSDPVYGPSVAEFFHRKRQAARSARTDSVPHAQLNKRRMENTPPRPQGGPLGDMTIPGIDPTEVSFGSRRLQNWLARP